MRAATCALAIARGALLGAADHGFQAGDRQALAHARALVDALVLAREKGDLLHDFAQVVGHHALSGRRCAPSRLPAR